MHRIALPVLATLILSLPSCMTGSSREIDIDRDLSGLDLTYFQSRSKETGSRNTESIDGKFMGTPAWFFPAVGFDATGSNALHYGDKGERTGYQHSQLSASALGLLSFAVESGEWDIKGQLQSWKRSHSMLAGLLFDSEESGDASGTQSFKHEVLWGMFGYRENPRRGYLRILWIPIPVADYEARR